MTREKATQNSISKKQLFSLVAVISATLLLFVACGDSSAKFCEIAATSVETRTQAEIDEYYVQLEAVAPSEIKADVATLLEDWHSVNFPLGGGNYSRPEEVSQAARNVFNFVGEECGIEGGVYLVFPEIGW
ncbi:MAG: hypothetical protein WAV05_15590 [Anaerolineales bacterium]